MSKASRNPGLFQRLLARPAPVFEDDAADLGTAFGMEVCLGRADAAAAALAAPAPRTSPGWVRRLTTRARSAP
jgi:hypothetical protein